MFLPRTYLGYTPPIWLMYIWWGENNDSVRGRWGRGAHSFLSKCAGHCGEGWAIFFIKKQCYSCQDPLTSLKTRAGLKFFTSIIFPRFLQVMGFIIQSTEIKFIKPARGAWAFDELRRYHTTSDSIGAPKMYIFEKRFLEI